MQVPRHATERPAAVDGRPSVFRRGDRGGRTVCPASRETGACATVHLDCYWLVVGGRKSAAVQLGIVAGRRPRYAGRYELAVDKTGVAGSAARR
jgi:hypothetical protein